MVITVNTNLSDSVAAVGQSNPSLSSQDMHEICAPMHNPFVNIIQMAVYIQESFLELST